MASLADGIHALRSLEHKIITYASEREGGFAGVLKSAADAEFAQVRAVCEEEREANCMPRARCMCSQTYQMHSSISDMSSRHSMRMRKQSPFSQARRPQWSTSAACCNQVAPDALLQPNFSHCKYVDTHVLIRHN